MKLYIIIAMGLFYSTSILSQDQPYYWYKGEKHFLEYNRKLEFIQFTETKSISEIESLFGDQHLEKVLNVEERTIQSNINSSRILRSSWATLIKHTDAPLNISGIDDINYSASYLVDENGLEVGLSDLFFVKINNPDDYKVLEKEALKNTVNIVRQCKNLPLWFTLSCSKRTQGNSLDMANSFYESGLFASSQPNFIVRDLTNSVNDEYYDDQWGLNNTGQNGGTSGLDINIEDAWDFTYGDPNITIAVFDKGADPNHPDLSNFSTLSYDTESESSPSVFYGSHGLSVAGIISATTNNTDGIAGIAPNTLLMTISNRLDNTLESTQLELADGIQWAAENGADVINNSWGHDYLVNDAIDEAIEYALESGRGGLGCVVIFISGNENSTNIWYPADSHSGVITVGAMSPCGERTSPSSCDTEDTWGSNYGTDLDIVAPGVLVPTIDRIGNIGYNNYEPIHLNNNGTLISSDYSDRDYTIWFNGTSAAGPHVSGVAGLILSANNGLSSQEVSDIIESTAQKINTGTYTYSLTTGRDNGTWNNQMGYGLLDAGEAVKEAVCEHSIESTSYTSDITISGCPDINMENVSVENNATLTIQNTGSISIIGPFLAESGTQLKFDP